LFCLCQKTFSKKSNLQRHMRINHLGMAAEPPQRQDVSDEQKQCKYCVRGFKDLKEHLKSCSYMKRHQDRKARTAYRDFLRNNLNLKRFADVDVQKGIAQQILKLLEDKQEPNSFLLLSGVAMTEGALRHLPSIWTILEWGGRGGGGKTKNEQWGYKDLENSLKVAPT
jgi:hypothetical protein